MPWKPVIHGDWVRSQLPQQKYVVNGKRRQSIKDAAKVIAKNFDDVPSHSGERKGLCDVDKVLKIWRERDMEQVSGDELRDCESRARIVKENEKKELQKLKMLRRALLQEGEEVLHEGNDLSVADTITSTADKERAKDVYFRAGEAYNKMREHTAGGELHQDCRKTCMELTTLRKNIRGKCQLCDWARNIAHLPDLPNLDPDGRSHSSGDGPKGGIPGEQMKKKLRAPYSHANNKLVEKLKSFKRRFDELAQQYDKTDKMLINQEVVLAAAERVRVAEEACSESESRIAELQAAIHADGLLLAAKVLELKTLAPAVAGTGFSFLVGAAGLNPAYIATPVTSNADGESELPPLANAGWSLSNSIKRTSISCSFGHVSGLLDGSNMYRVCCSLSGAFTCAANVTVDDPSKFTKEFPRTPM